MEPRISSWTRSECMQPCLPCCCQRVYPLAWMMDVGSRISTSSMSLWLADKASGRPHTQAPHIELDSNLFLLESRVSHGTAPHLAMRLLVDFSSRPRLTLMNIMSAEENHSLACICPREQPIVSSALEFFLRASRSK